MRRVYLLSAVLLALLGFGAQRAHAQEFTIEVGTSSIDDTFNERFSDDPVVQLTGSVDLTDELYAEGYVYSGFSDPLNDDSSEYGLEIGGEWDVAEGTSVNIAAGRWANYQGGGFNAGDWFGAVRVSHGNATIAATALSGDTDTVILNVQYELPVNERLTLTPSVAFFPEDSTLNPALGARYRLTNDLALNIGVVYPETDEGRELYAAVSLGVRW